MTLPGPLGTSSGAAGPMPTCGHPAAAAPALTSRIPLVMAAACGVVCDGVCGAGVLGFGSCLRRGLDDLLQDGDIGLNLQKILSGKERVLIKT